MFPDAPVRFSMMTGWLSDRRKCSATTRARMSVEPPGGKGTTSVTVRSGYAWPRACPNGFVAASPAKPASTDRRLGIFIVVPSMPRLAAIVRRQQLLHIVEDRRRGARHLLDAAHDVVRAD